MKTYNEVVDAKLFAYTQIDVDYGVELEDMGELVAYCAKVSNPDSVRQADMERADSLIDYLMKHSHWSPLEMANVILRITTTRDIGRQIIRHPTFRFQEFSQRYAKALTGEDQGVEFVLSEPRLQDRKNRQSSIELLPYDWRYGRWLDIQREIAELVEERYKEVTDEGFGLAKEQARKILPEGLTTTTMFVNGSLRSWIHYADLRRGNGTQKEHQQIAVACANAICKVFPLINDERT